jgi:hypothetical protein
MGGGNLPPFLLLTSSIWLKKPIYIPIVNSLFTADILKANAANSTISYVGKEPQTPLSGLQSRRLW